MANIIIIANSSRKSGKSTTFLNLGICLATLSQRTLLLDLNTEGWVGKLCNPTNKPEKVTMNMFLTYKKEAEINFEGFDDFDQVLIDCPIQLNNEVFQALVDFASVIVPVEMEFYGLNNLPTTLRELDKTGIKLLGLLPVLVKQEAGVSTKILEKLQEHFGRLVFENAIQRNYYLARQREYKKFILSELAEKAAVTYLPLASLLLNHDHE